MHLLGLTIVQFAGLLAASVAAVAALYALRQKRRTVVVSFTPLWERVTTDPRRTSLFERLRRVASFLLQVAFILLVLAAVARPRLGGDAAPSRRFVVVIDSGASMGARLDLAHPRTRLDEARTLAKDFILSLGGEDSVSVVAPGSAGDYAAPFEADRKRVFEILDALRPGEGASDVEAATRFAVSLAGGRADRVVVFSDVAAAYVASRCIGMIAVSEEETQPGAAGLHKQQDKIIRIGKPLDNVAITKFAARPLAESTGEYELFWEVANFGRAEAHLGLKIDRVAAGRATLDERALDLKPGERVSDVLRGLADNDLALEAKITGPKGEPWLDALSSDDLARASVRAPRVVKVLVVGAPNFFLDAALKSDPFVAPSRVAPQNYAGPGDADAVILDSALPTKGVPAQAVWLNPPAGSSLRGAEEIRDLFVDRVDASHPVMRWVGRLADVAVARSRVLRAEPGDAVLASCAGSPVMIARERGTERLVALGFDLRESDLPLRVAFPKIIRNAVRWAATGETVDAGGVSGIKPRDGTSNLLAETEEGDTPEGGCATQAAPATSRTAGLDLWPALALAALALTLVEWVSYHRRWTV